MIDRSAVWLARWRKLLNQQLTVTRSFAWRETRDPWHILVSEVMLQQTQAQRVREPYRAMIERFDTPASMAVADQAEVIRLWSGLGYNSRAIRLHRCAQEIVRLFEGHVPNSEEALLRLPGIGPYTARAVLVFAFERDLCVLDTNVSRVLARCVAGEQLSRRQAQTLADALVEPGRAWTLNQALLDHGASFCQAKPQCSACPLRRKCAWAKAGFGEPDPAAVSALAPTKQTPFAGSLRQVRGRLLALARDGDLTTAVLEALILDFDVERVQRALSDLEREGFITKHRNRWTLA